MASESRFWGSKEHFGPKLMCGLKFFIRDAEIKLWDPTIELESKDKN